MKIPNPLLPNPHIQFGSDPKKVLCVAFFMGIGFLVFLGDQVCFTRASESVLETLSSYPAVWGYHFFEDRFFANAFSFCFWSGTLGMLVCGAVTYIEKQWIEPMMMKKTLEQLEREKKWMNQYGKDLF